MQGTVLFVTQRQAVVLECWRVSENEDAQGRISGSLRQRVSAVTRRAWQGWGPTPAPRSPVAVVRPNDTGEGCGITKRLQASLRAPAWRFRCRTGRRRGENRRESRETP